MSNIGGVEYNCIFTISLFLCHLSYEVLDNHKPQIQMFSTPGNFLDDTLVVLVEPSIDGSQSQSPPAASLLRPFATSVECVMFY